MKAIFHENGFPKQFYTQDDAPHNAVEITEEQHKDLIENQGKRKWNGSAVVAYAAPFNAEQCANAIKAIAGQVIISIAPEYKQRNMLAAALRIENKQRLGTSTAEEDDTADAIITLWNRVEAIRAKSDELETQYIALGNDLTAADLASIKTELETAGV